MSAENYIPPSVKELRKVGDSIGSASTVARLLGISSRTYVRWLADPKIIKWAQWEALKSLAK